MKRVGRWRRFARELRGTQQREFSACLAGQITATQEGCELARQAAAGLGSTDAVRERMAEVEHRGDQERARLVDELTRSLTAPFDREDLFRVSRGIDDVLDNLRDFVRELHLFDVETGEGFQGILHAITTSLDELDGAILHVGTDLTAVTRCALAASKSSNVVRRLYQQAVADELAQDPVTVQMLKRRELLRRLDVVGLRLREAADALADGAMKRS